MFVHDVAVAFVINACRLYQFAYCMATICRYPMSWALYFPIISRMILGILVARRKNVLSQSAYLFTLSNYQSNNAKDNRK